MVNRLSSKPTKLDCQICGCIFIGAPQHALCGRCVDPTAALNDVLRHAAERMERCKADRDAESLARSVVDLRYELAVTR